VADAGARALLHLLRAADELARALAAALEALGADTRAHSSLRAALRDEERRWRARAAHDVAAARVAAVFGALAALLEPRERAAPSEPRPKFDPPQVRWDTPARWRS